MSKIFITRDKADYIFFEEFNTIVSSSIGEKSFVSRSILGVSPDVGLVFDDGDGDEMTLINICPGKMLPEYFKEVSEDYLANGLNINSLKCMILKDLTENDLMNLNSDDIDLRASVVVGRFSNPP